MRIAAIDLGSNSVILLIAIRDRAGHIVPLYQESQITRIGYRVTETGRIQESSAAATLGVLEHYFDIAQKNGADHLMITATSAMRDAANSADFLDQVEKAIGIRPRIISGETEAHYVMKAVRHDFPELGGPVLIFDIGGGSTELIRYRGNSIESLRSINIGAVRLTEQFVRHDPMSDTEHRSARHAIWEILPDLNFSAQISAVGVGGTITTLQAVNKKVPKYQSNVIHKSILQRSEISDVFRLFRALSLAERKKLAGLPPKRADIIPMGALIALTILEKYDIPQLYVSDRGLRWGMVYEKFAQPTDAG